MFGKNKFLEMLCNLEKGDTLYINLKENNIETDAYLATALGKNILKSTGKRIVVFSKNKYKVLYEYRKS